MAYGLRQISPIDLKKSVALGVKIPFSYPSVFLSVYTTKDQIRYNIMNYLLTNNRERLFDPNFGANLRASLFEQINTKNTQELEDQLTEKISSNFPQINVIDLSIYNAMDQNSILIEFSYVIKASNESDDVSITIQNA
jgi:phage baseplate assembly protein W